MGWPVFLWVAEGENLLSWLFPLPAAAHTPFPFIVKSSKGQTSLFSHFIILTLTLLIPPCLKTLVMTWSPPGSSALFKSANKIDLILLLAARWRGDNTLLVSKTLDLSGIMDIC